MSLGVLVWDEPGETAGEDVVSCAVGYTAANER